MISYKTRDGELGVLRVREHPLGAKKHPLEFKEKLHKTLYNSKIQQKYDVRSSNQGKSMVRTAKNPSISYELKLFSGVEIHMEMDMDWKWMEMEHKFLKRLWIGLDLREGHQLKTIQ